MDEIFEEYNCDLEYRRHLQCLKLLIANFSENKMSSYFVFMLNYM